MLQYYINKDILQYIFNDYIDHRNDVYILEKVMNNKFKFKLKKYIHMKKDDRFGLLLSITKSIDNRPIYTRNFDISDKDKKNIYPDSMTVFSLNNTVTQIQYYLNSNIIKQKSYINIDSGQTKNSIKYFRSGIIFEYIIFSNDNYMNICRNYTNGQIKYSCNYQYTYKNGMEFFYYKNGKVKYKSIYSEGVLLEPTKEYYRDGTEVKN
jgi:antitoxin component YwqK of YwqJK toxin-antitoxin module